MKVITAPEHYTKQKDDIFCFLAGGITDCYDWQKEVIAELKERSNGLNNLVIFNPRRENFPIGNPSAAQEQIEWEFKNLERMDIFSMYFANSKSVQPICMYELGRYLARMKERFPENYKDRIVINIEDGYSRTADVIIQTKLAVGIYDIPKFFNEDGPYLHALGIEFAYYFLCSENEDE